MTVAPQPHGHPEPAEPVLFEDALSYTPVPKSVRLVRQRAARLVGEWGRPQLAGDVTLLVSEAATNAVLHARVPGRLFRVRMALTATRLRVEVSDPRPDVAAVAVSGRGAVSGREGGWGLVVVRTVASRWGVVPYGHGIGKTVWFELGLAP